MVIGGVVREVVDEGDATKGGRHQDNQYFAAPDCASGREFHHARYSPDSGPVIEVFPGGGRSL